VHASRFNEKRATTKEDSQAAIPGKVHAMKQNKAAG
jgi:hypothetical protein